MGSFIRQAVGGERVGIIAGDGRQRLAAGWYDHIGNVRAAIDGQRALRGRVKPAHGLDLVAKQFNAHRAGGGYRENVHDAAAPAELPTFFHHWRGFITHVQPGLR